ncbi:hypothetical protein GCM10007359_20220 [Rothia aerolata]|uniref:Uncharacterized protein n=1 Tax=Rothia aerolata TaxID=1812262 RepID=A0A917IVZ4_9MICC|nr:hypothetical protein GCM10007359_20220 [Rothia aerolata]
MTEPRWYRKTRGSQEPETRGPWLERFAPGGTTTTGANQSKGTASRAQRFSLAHTLAGVIVDNG